MNTSIEILTLEPEKKNSKTNSLGVWLFLILLQSKGDFETFKASEFKSAITSLVIYDVNF